MELNKYDITKLEIIRVILIRNDYIMTAKNLKEIIKKAKQK